MTPNDGPPRHSKVPRVEVLGVTGIPEIEPGAPLGELIAEAARRQSTAVQEGDVLVVTQKIVSKAEGRLVRLDQVTPSSFAEQIAVLSDRDPRLVELVLRESRAIVRMDPSRGILITETRHGFVCANAGIDASNIPGDDVVSLLPKDPDRSARAIRKQVQRSAGIARVAVIVSDTFGRPWREGQTNVAIGVAGMEPLRDYSGTQDSSGKLLKVTMIAEADELASATELVMAKAACIPAAIVRGHTYQAAHGTADALIRDRTKDLFR